MTQVSLYLFLFSRTNLKQHNISVTSNVVKKVTMNLDLSKASGPDCIPVVVLKNCDPELSYILAELFSKCFKGSCFPDCWKVSSVVHIFKNVGDRYTAKTYHLFSLLSVVSKFFEKLLNDRIVNYLEKCGLFSDFQYGFRSSRSTAGPLTVVSDRIARAFNRSRATRAVAWCYYNIAIYADYSTLYSKCDQASDLATTWIGFWTWIWTTRHCGVG